MDIISFLSRMNLSQVDLAAELDTSGANVNKWVNGKGVPSYEICQKLLAMGMTVEELFDVPYNEQHHLVFSDPDTMSIDGDEFRMRWIEMMKEWNEQQRARDGEI